MEILYKTFSARHNAYLVVEIPQSVLHSDLLLNALVLVTATRGRGWWWKVFIILTEHMRWLVSWYYWQMSELFASFQVVNEAGASSRAFRWPDCIKIRSIYLELIEPIPVPSLRNCLHWYECLPSVDSVLSMQTVTKSKQWLKNLYLSLPSLAFCITRLRRQRAVEWGRWIICDWNKPTLINKCNSQP